MNKRVYWEYIIFALILALGIFLRMKTYLVGNELWLDEAMLAKNIISRNIIFLIGPLGYNQSAPYGFLFLEKIATLMGGVTPFSFHFFPLIFGICTLPLSYLFTKKLSRSWGIASIVLLILSTSPSLIRYSVELKQYSGEIFFVLLYLYFYYEQLKSTLKKKVLPKKESILFGISTILISLFTQTAPFILLITGVPILYIKWTEGESDFKDSISITFKAYLLAAGTYLITFLTAGIFTLGGSFMRDYWTSNGGFLMIPRTQHEIQLMTNTIKVIPSLSFSMSPWLGISALIISIMIFFLKKYRKKIASEDSIMYFSLLTLILFMLVASALKVYPISLRTSMFLIPVILGAIVLPLRAVKTKDLLVKSIVGIATGLFIFYGGVQSNFKTATEVINDQKEYKNTRLKGVNKAIIDLSKERESSELILVDYLGKSVLDYYAYANNLNFQYSDISAIPLSRSGKEYIENLIIKLESINNHDQAWLVFLYRPQLGMDVKKELENNNEITITQVIEIQDVIFLKIQY